MTSTVISAILGLGFWLAAARYYSEGAVGQGSAAISAMRFLAGLATTGLIGAVIRFIPMAGPGTRRLVGQAYLIAFALSGALSGLFLLTLDAWGPSYQFLDGVTSGAWFTAMAIAWAWLSLQDGVLTGLRTAVWVPIANTAFSVAKLVLLVVLAGTLPATGIFFSWSAAIGVSVIPIAWLVFGRLIPRRDAQATQGDGRPTNADIGRFLAGDFSGALFAFAMVNLLPVCVAATAAPAENAYFYISFTVVSTIDLLAINMAASLIVEVGYTPTAFRASARAALRRMTAITLPISAALLLLAPSVLGLFGTSYAEHGTPLLRFMALAVVPGMITQLYFGILRAQARVGRLAALQGLLCALVLGSTLLLLGTMGLTGVGLALLSSQALLTLIVLPDLISLLQNPQTMEEEESAPNSEQSTLTPPPQDWQREFYRTTNMSRL
ncbi:hypothetical protein GR925_37445 [Streptomyces sp. HUCO-GS316]|uniref:lipopolysaccharide biosynthesis protein n=1 Tax=Streptomyces sp. HUCO-GS316 TaxID=2692198 RepID=UPI00136B7C8F|nr:hypothetical protein [Streptomyces sp. HUCO-GS316]MXM68933.1 hypothetical protein [Streptomyces sp. HUCO-GS316]